MEGYHTNKRQIATDKANKECKSVAVPSRLVDKFFKNEVDRAFGGKNHQWNQDGEEAQSMQDQDHSLDLGQKSGCDRIDKDTDQQCSPHQQGAVPSLIVVVGIVEHEKALNHGSTEEDASRRVGVPA